MSDWGEEMARQGMGAWSSDADSDGSSGDVVIHVGPHGRGVTPPTPPTPPDPPTPPTPPDPMTDMDLDLGDLDIDIDVDLDDLGLASDQLDQLREIFDDSRGVIDPAREALDEASNELRDALEDADTDESDIGRLVDAVSAQEAKIRKAEILAWVKSRHLLDDKQRTRVEKARVKVIKHRHK
jgi:Spy/CpxP family protein refolding chaperone